jgi:hypothetical protein
MADMKRQRATICVGIDHLRGKPLWIAIPVNTRLITKRQREESGSQA